jgi:hypothetical protein
MQQQLEHIIQWRWRRTAPGLFVLLLVPTIPPRSRWRQEGSLPVPVPVAISIERANNMLYQTETGTHRYSLAINRE